jgi:hypothetical protein
MIHIEYCNQIVLQRQDIYQRTIKNIQIPTYSLTNIQHYNNIVYKYQPLKESSREC